MKSGLRSWFVAAAILLIGAPRVFADISLVSKTPMPQGTRYDAAFDPVNQVYLLSWDNSPVTGQLADANGIPFGPRFTIANEYPTGNPYTSWATVTAGGTAQDPAFLVTYLAIEGAAVNKYGRLVRVINGQVSIGPRVFIANVTATWFAANSARAVWDVDRFVVATRVKPAGAPFDEPQLQQIDLAANVSGAVLMGDNLDYEGGPSVACGPNHICMLTGFAQGMPFGGKGGIHARLFNGQTLAPITGVFYLDDHSTFMDTPQVVYNTAAGRFSTLWYRRTGNVVDFRTVGTDGVMGPLDLTRSFGPGAGDLGYDYNEATGTGLLVTKVGGSAELWGLEIGTDGYPTGKNTLITVYDNLNWPTYSTSVTRNVTKGSWLVTYMLARNGWAATVGGGPAGPPPPNPQMGVNGPGAGVVIQPFDVVGWAIDLGSPSTSGADAIHVWAWPTTNGAVSGSPIFVGATTPSVPRADVGAVFGARFTNSGYQMTVSSLPGGTYLLAIYMHSTVTNTFNAVRTVDIKVSTPVMAVATASGPLLGTGFFVGGWSLDLAAPSGSGVDAIHTWAYPVINGVIGAPIWIGVANYGVARPDVAAIFGPQFLNSGFDFTAGLAPGTYFLAVFSHSSVTGTFNAMRVLQVNVQ
jgi:hypothetical protein